MRVELASCKPHTWYASHKPVFLRVFFSFEVKIKCDLRIKANAKVVVHNTFLTETLSAEKYTDYRMKQGQCQSGCS